MFTLPVLDPTDTAAFYDALAGQLEALLGDERDRIANLANEGVVERQIGRAHV